MKKIIITILIFLCIQVGYGQCAWVDISAGTNHSLAIKTDNTLWAWGSNNEGQLGLSQSISNSSIPIKIGTSNNWIAISAGHYFSIGLKSDGTIWGWGFNQYYQLGLNNNVPSNVFSPTQIGVANDWKKISAGINKCFAIKQDNTLWAWGYGEPNCLGFNDYLNKMVPTQLGVDTWNSISCSDRHVLAIKSNGKLFSWGENAEGSGGIGNNGTNYLPTQIGTADWAEVSAGYFHSAGIQTNGTLWTWGLNNSGQLGDGTNITKYSPTQVGTASDWLLVASCREFTKGVRSPSFFVRKIYSWGNNSYGQLGDGTTISRYLPIQITNTDTWSLISNGPFSSHSLWLNYNQTIYSSGINGNGQLGDGTTAQKNSLTPIGCGTIVPITLTSFAAKNQTITNLLNWTTENEINNQYFEIQHSIDGTNFKPIGKVNGQLNSTIPHSYDFTHNTPGNGMNYYRLKQVDVDGKFTYSKIEKVNNTTNNISGYPNPVTNELFVKGAKNNMPFSIVNNVGQTVLSGQHQSSKSIQTAILSKGIYFLKMDDKVIKFLKQ